MVACGQKADLCKKKKKSCLKNICIIVDGAQVLLQPGFQSMPSCLADQSLFNVVLTPSLYKGVCMKS